MKHERERKKLIQRTKEYKLTRNENASIRREEEKKYEKDVVDKYKAESMLFYRFLITK